MTHLKQGDKAPLIYDTNENIDLPEGIENKKLILYFYPKDNTPGCTAEACNLRDNYDVLREKGYEIAGVSPDSEKSHEKFRVKHQLPFHLIADPDKKLLEAFGVWGEKKMYGKSYQGVHRTTFVIDIDGTILKIIKKVKTNDHARQILEKMGE